MLPNPRPTPQRRKRLQESTNGNEYDAPVELRLQQTHTQKRRKQRLSGGVKGRHCLVLNGTNCTSSERQKEWD